MRRHRSHDAGHDSWNPTASPAPGKRTRSAQLAPVQRRQSAAPEAVAPDGAAPANDHLFYPTPAAANDDGREPVSFVDSLLHPHVHAAPVQRSPREPTSGEVVDDGAAPGPAGRRAALVADGTACDQEPSRIGCYLDPQRRGYAISALQAVALSAAQSRHAACLSSRIEIMTKTTSGWSGLVEALYYGVTGPLIATATKALVRSLGKLAAEAAIRNHDRVALAMAKAAAEPAAVENVKAALTNASRGVRKELMKLADSRGDKGKEMFLMMMQSQIKPEVDTLLLDTTATLTDFELELLIESYRDPEVHSVTAYKKLVDEMLAGYDRNKIDEVGREYDARGDVFKALPAFRVETGRLAWVTYRGSRRLALLQVDPRRERRPFAARTSPRSSERFVRWIDHEFEALAVSMYWERTGRQPEMRDLDPDEVHDADERANGSQTEGA